MQSGLIRRIASFAIFSLMLQAANGATPNNYTASTKTGNESKRLAVDSTTVAAGTGPSLSACVTVDGIKADGSAGTPSYSPYDGGYRFLTVAEASARFGRTLIQTKSTAPTACITDCPASTSWNGTSCASTCTPSSNIATTACPSGYTGTYSVTTTKVCPSGATTITSTKATSCVAINCPINSSWDGSACTCNSGYAQNGSSCQSTCANGGSSPVVGSSRTITGSCPAGYSGNTYQDQTAICTGTFSSAWTNSGPKDSSECSLSCTPSTTTTSFTPSCGNGYTAVPNSGTQKVVVTCPGGATSVSVTNNGTCTPNLPPCVPPAATNSYFTPSCPDTSTAVPNSGVNRTTWSCPSVYGSPTSSVSMTSAGTCNVTCTPSGPTQTPFTPSCPNGQSPVANSGTNTKTTTCTGGVASTSSVVTNAGTCTVNQAPPSCTTSFFYTWPTGKKLGAACYYNEKMCCGSTCTIVSQQLGFVGALFPCEIQ